MLDEYNARNNNALKTLINKHQVKLRQFPPEVMQALKGYTHEVLTEQAANDENFAKIWASYADFLQSMREYNDLTLKEYYQNR